MGSTELLGLNIAGLGLWQIPEKYRLSGPESLAVVCKQNYGENDEKKYLWDETCRFSSPL